MPRLKRPWPRRLGSRFQAEEALAAEIGLTLQAHANLDLAPV